MKLVRTGPVHWVKKTKKQQIYSLVMTYKQPQSKKQPGINIQTLKLNVYFFLIFYFFIIYILSDAVDPPHIRGGKRPPLNAEFLTFGS